MQHSKNEGALILNKFHYFILKVLTFLFPALARTILNQYKVIVIDKQATESQISAAPLGLPDVPVNMAALPVPKNKHFSSKWQFFGTLESPFGKYCQRIHDQY